MERARNGRLSSDSDKKWLLLSGVVLGFLFQHAVQGWCPPVPLLRQLGIRTRGEIDREKYALKALRGDFDHLRQERGETGEVPTQLPTASS